MAYLEAKKQLVNSGARNNRRKMKQTLLSYCDVSERTANLVFPMSLDESRLTCKLTWQAFDRLIYNLFFADLEVLGDFVAEPEMVRERAHETKFVGSDAIPVYLDPSVGKVVVPNSYQEQHSKRRKVRQLRQEAAAGDEVPDLPDVSLPVHLTASGASRQEKDRLTVLCRQIYDHPLNSKQQLALTGRAAQTICVTHCSTRCRLEWMCPLTHTWLVDHEIWEEGHPVKRKKGQPINPRLMLPFVQLRKECPELFYKSGELEPLGESAGVLIWGHPNAYQDEILSDWNAREFRAEVGDYFPLVHICDMFAGELTSHMESLDWTLNMCKLVLGPKQTAKLQVTDTVCAKIGKNVVSEKKVEQRRRARKKAQLDGVSPTLTASAFEIMESTLAMHSAWQEAGEEGKIAQGLVDALFAEYEPGGEDFSQLVSTKHSPRFRSFTRGSTSKLDNSFHEMRHTHFSESGVPEPVDWNELARFRAAA